MTTRGGYATDIGPPCLQCAEQLYSYNVTDGRPEVQARCAGCHAPQWFLLVAPVSPDTHISEIREGHWLASAENGVFYGKAVLS